MGGTERVLSALTAQKVLFFYFLICRCFKNDVIYEKVFDTQELLGKAKPNIKA
jgi:hypothetical protein